MSSLHAPASRIVAAVRVRGWRVLLRAVGVPLAGLLRRFAERSNRGAGVALVYHRVGDPAGDPRRELVPALGSSLFAAQVRHLARSYRLVEGQHLLEATSGRRRGSRFPVAITFDDDLASHTDVAAPILGAERAPATFFVSGASLERPHRFWWERLQAAVDAGLDLSPLGFAADRGINELGRRIQELPAGEREELEARLAELLGPDPPESGLRAEGVRRLASSGFEIGFHTRRHDLLPPLRDEELGRAMRAGLPELERAVGRPLSTISYPHGQADERVAAAAREAGFRAGFTGSPTAVKASSDTLLLGRVSPSYRSLGELAFDVSWALFRAAFSGTAPSTAARRARRRRRL